MGYLNATPEDEANFSQLGQGDAGTNQLPGPTAWQGAIESVPQGIASGIADAYQFSRDVENGVATFASKHPWAYGIPAIGAPAAAYNLVPDDYKKNADKIRQQVADWGKIDPQLTGSVGQFAAPIAENLTTLAIGSPAGPFGAALMAGGAHGDEAYRQGIAEGLDARTAAVTAAEQGIFAGVAAFLPVRFAGPLLKSTLKAGTVYTGLGIAQREMQHDALATNGYEDMAAAVKPFDLKSMAADFLMASFVNAGAKVFGKPEAAPRPLPSEVDGASVVQVDAHAERAGFGVATDPETAGLHSQTLAAHIDAMLHDRPMPEIAPEAAQKMADGVIADPQQMEMLKTVQETVNADPLLADVQNAPEAARTLDLPSAGLAEGHASATAELEAGQSRLLATADQFESSVLDPVTREMMARLVNEHGHEAITLEDGSQGTIADAMEQIHQQAQETAERANLFDVAVACFLSTGGAQ